MHRFRKLIIPYFIALHLSIAFLVVKTNFIDKVKLKLGFPKPEISDFYVEITQYHQRIDQSMPENSVLFIGDSHIQSLYVEMSGFRTANFGIGNDTTMGVRQRLPNYQALKMAQSVVLQVGINDLEYRSVRQTIESYEQLLQQVPESSSILLNGVFPVSETQIDDGRQWNQEITLLNVGLRALCSTSTHCRYLDTGETFKDKDGDLSEKYHIGDGVHLNNVANQIWRSAIYQNLKQHSIDH